MVRIIVGAGHGGGGVTPGKRSPAGEYEHTFNDHVADGFIAEIQKYEGVQIKRVDDDDASDGYQDVSLQERVRQANAWNADYWFSFHHNANTGKWGSWTGTETYYYEGNAEGKALAQVVQKAMLEVYGLRDRGIKRGNHLYIIRNSKMTTILTEGGFMDSTIDIKVMRDSARLRRAGANIAKRFAEWKKLKLKSPVHASAPKPSTPSAGRYTVQKGDTLWGIANKNGLTVATLKSLNGLKSDVIQPGEVLNLTASKPAPAPPVASAGVSKAEQDAFLKFIKDGALRSWQKYRVLPSIVAAQAIIESGWGKSELATKANNLFGVKDSADWKGPHVEHLTSEQDSKGNVTKVKANFRKYASKADSVEDHGAFFTSTAWRKTNYAKFIGEKDYKAAAHALRNAGYATDVKYAFKLIDKIEELKLYEWDKEAFTLAERLYTDVEAGSDMEQVLQKAKDYGLMQGYPDGTFKPSGNLTRYHMAAVAVRIYEALQKK